MQRNVLHLVNHLSLSLLHHQAYETVLERSPYPCSLRTSGEGEPVRIGAQGASDEDQANLEIWHEVEKENPEIFGRMHIVYAQKRWR